MHIDGQRKGNRPTDTRRAQKTMLASRTIGGDDEKSEEAECTNIETGERGEGEDTEYRHLITGDGEKLATMARRGVRP